MIAKSSIQPLNQNLFNRVSRALGLLAHLQYEGACSSTASAPLFPFILPASL